MRYASRAALRLLPLVIACLAAGCADKGIDPDENSSPATGKHIWSKRFGDVDDQCAYAAAVDPSGNVILAGYFNGAVDFGGGALTCAGSSDIFVAKFGSNGGHLWSKRFGDVDDQRALTAAADPSGNVILAGYFNGTVDFGGGPITSAGGSDIFIAKFGPDGGHLWSKHFGDASGEAHAVAADASGNVTVTGSFNGIVDFGGGALTSAGGNDIFIAKFGPDGGHLWSGRYGDADNQNATSIAIDASGNAIVTGCFYVSVEFGLPHNEIYIAKFGPGGGQLWSKRFRNGGGEAVAADASGNVIVTGYFLGTVDFDGGVLTCEGGFDIFVAKFGPDGGHLWSKRFGDTDDQYAASITIDDSGNMIVTGSFNGAVDFGGGALTSTGGDRDVFIAKLGPDGGHLWSKRFGDASDQVAASVSHDASGNVIVAGYFFSSIDFGGGPLWSAHAGDIFVAKLSH